MYVCMYVYIPSPLPRRGVASCTVAPSTKRTHRTRPSPLLARSKHTSTHMRERARARTHAQSCAPAQARTSAHSLFICPHKRAQARSLSAQARTSAHSLFTNARTGRRWRCSSSKYFSGESCPMDRQTDRRTDRNIDI